MGRVKPAPPVKRLRIGQRAGRGPQPGDKHRSSRVNRGLLRPVSADVRGPRTTSQNPALECRNHRPPSDTGPLVMRRPAALQARNVCRFVWLLVG